MKPWAKWTAKSVLVTTGFAAAGCGITGVAFAGTGGTHTGNVSVLDRNHVNAPVNVPADICGNAAAILGIATAGCQGGASVAAAHTSSAHRAGWSGPEYGNIAIGHGNTVKVPVTVAADACGNSIGHATARCHGGIHLPASSTSHGSSTHIVNGGPLKRVTSMSANRVTHKPAKRVTRKSAKKVARTAAFSGPVETVPAASGLMSGLPISSALTGLTGQNGLSRLTEGADLTSVTGQTNARGLTGAPGMTKHATLLPASTLAAAERGAGIGNGSFASLAIGALLAGAAALKLASRRPHSRKARSGQVSA
jgi:hypothetical protein